MVALIKNRNNFDSYRDILSEKVKEIFDKNLSNYEITYKYKEKVKRFKSGRQKMIKGQGIFYFNNPHQLLDRLELLGYSVLAGNIGVLPEFSQIVHRLNQMKVL